MKKYELANTPREMMQVLANNLRGIRKSQKLSQKKLSEISGVSFATVKKFELTGVISLESFLQLCRAVGRLDELEKLLLLNDLESKRHLFDID